MAGTQWIVLAQVGINGKHLAASKDEWRCSQASQALVLEWSFLGAVQHQLNPSCLHRMGAGVGGLALPSTSVCVG